MRTLQRRAKLKSERLKQHDATAERWLADHFSEFGLLTDERQFSRSAWLKIAGDRTTPLPPDHSTLVGKTVDVTD
jgi:hypothetical protein